MTDVQTRKPINQHRARFLNSIPDGGDGQAEEQANYVDGGPIFLWESKSDEC
jgi:hypothetical protein